MNKRELSKVFSKLSREEVNLESHKLELSLESDALAVQKKMSSERDKLESKLDNAFVPIRRIEKLIENLEGYASLSNGFKDYMKALYDAEKVFEDTKNKIKNSEQELGIKIPEPKFIGELSQQLSFFQRMEQNFRDDLNEYNKFIKKFK